MDRPRIVVFASGTRTNGGSGFENLVKASNDGVLEADIVGVISNHADGGVHEKAKKLGIPFVFFPGPYTAEEYQDVVSRIFRSPGLLRTEGGESGGEWVALSGWLKLVKGLDPTRTFNIHPALLSQFGGKFGGEGMWGHRVHTAIKNALDAGLITETGISMHFVTDEYDRGPVFFEQRIPLEKGMTEEQIAEAVHQAELEWQPKITDMVVHGEISWDGKNASSLVVPSARNF
jgi:phosphoribosylglycinamide formyltransferase-1